jgi:hypothetical protein
VESPERPEVKDLQKREEKMNYLSPAKVLKGAAMFALLLSSSLILIAQKADSAQVSKLLTEIKEHSSLAAHDAELLDSYTRSQVSWKLHAYSLAEIKEHVNDLGRDFNEAQRLREEGSPWQQQAIDQIEPLLKGMAAHLSATIEHLNNNQGRVRMQPYVDYVRANQEYATKTSALIHDFVDYGDAKAKSEQLEQKLQLPDHPGAE